VVCVRLVGLLHGRERAAGSTTAPARPEDAEIPAGTPETSVTCGFPTSPIVGLDAVSFDDAPVDDRSDQARAHEAAAEVLADRGDWRRAYHHLKAAVSLVRDERTLPAGVPDQLRDEVDRLRRERAEAREQSRRDALTATWNRRYLDERLGTLRDGAHEGAVCVALADVDHFKEVNDTHGHALGDEVLRRLVDLMSEDLRVTVSVGVACLDCRDGDTAPSPGLDAADALLYVAKRAGRNAVAYRDTADGEVRLAGAAGGRRGIGAAVRRAFPSG